MRRLQVPIVRGRIFKDDLMLADARRLRMLLHLSSVVSYELVLAVLHEFEPGLADLVLLLRLVLHLVLRQTVSFL